MTAVRYCWIVTAALFACMLLLAYLCAHVVSSGTAIRARRAALASCQQQAALLVRTIANSPGPDSPQSPLAALGGSWPPANGDYRFDYWLLSSTGSPIVASVDGSPSPRPERVLAIADGTDPSVVSDTDDGERIIAAARVDATGREGVVCVATSVAPIRAVASRTFLWTLIPGVFAALLIFAIGWLVNVRLVGPLELAFASQRATLAGLDPAKSLAVPLPWRVPTSLVRATREVRQQVATIEFERHKFATILGSIGEALIAVDADEHVLHVNEAAIELLDLKSTGQGQRSLWEVCRVTEVRAAIGQVLAENQEVHGEFELISRGRSDLLSWHATPLRDRGRALFGAVLLLRDVTRLRQLETVRSDFVTNVSHELKTPTTAIRGLAETLLDDEAAPTELRRRFLTRIVEQSMRLSTLVSDLLVLARLESEGDQLDLEPIDFRQLVQRSVRAVLGPTIEETYQLSVELVDGPVIVSGEDEALRQVIDNLLANAITYTPGGGRISVRVGLDGDYVFFEVSDSGPGIERKHQSRIFERFYRVDKARSRELGGTGLGLSIVKHVCRAHGGEVQLESEPGHGSTFRVRLPVAPSA